MSDKTLIDDLVKKISSCLPKNLGVLKSDFELQLRHTIAGCLAKFNLVTREEFDIQTDALERARKQLEELQKKVADLEKRR